jgi:ketosteroid isomerase-like protein
VNVTVLPVFGLSGEGHDSAKQMWDRMKQVIDGSLSFNSGSVQQFYVPDITKYSSHSPFTLSSERPL